MMQVASVVFQNSPKLYDYFTDLPLKAGDLAVVPAGAGLAVVKVKKVKDASDKAKKLVIQKVDLEGYQERVAWLRQAGEVR